MSEKEIKCLKERMSAGEVTFGSWITIGHPAVAEIMAFAGFDWLTIDMEHSAITLSEAQNLIQTIELSGSTPLVRVGDNNPNEIKRVMDAGSHGVIVPQINSAEDALMAVSNAKYPPKGTRGVGLGRAQGYGCDFDEYREWCDARSVVIVQIENIRAVENIDSILEVDGVDGFIVGPYDLSASLGVPGMFDHPLFLDAMKVINDHVIQSSYPVPGFHVVPPDVSMVKEKISEGYRFIAYSLDSLILAENSRRDLSEIAGENIRKKEFVKKVRK